MTAQLSFTDTKGYYGLTVQPTYDEMLRSLKRPIRIPQPDRSAKYYALGPYRAFLLEQAKRYNDSQRKDLEYDDTGAQLPAAAERGQQESMAGTDDTWNRQEQFNSNLNTEEARRVAEDALASERRAQANQMRRHQLSAYGPTRGHWTIEAHDKDLEYRGIPHAAPLPKLTMPAGRWQAPPGEYSRTAPGHRVPDLRATQPGTGRPLQARAPRSSGRQQELPTASRELSDVRN